MYNFVIALLAKYTRMTEEEAKKIADHLNRSIMPHSYDESVKIIEAILKELDNSK